MEETLFKAGTARDKIANVSMALPGWADDLTWGFIWNAVKAEINETRTGLKQGSKEYFNAVIERFDSIVHGWLFVSELL